MSFQYDQYLARHRANVKRGFDWLSENLPELMTNTLTAGWNIEFAHDRSKNEPDEYDAYDAYFYGNNRSYEVVQQYQRAWLLHIHRNPHHWQHWILIRDDMEDGELETVLEMPYDYIIEMVCDWWSFSWQSGNLYEIFKWYEEHSKYMKLATQTKRIVDNILGKIEARLNELEIEHSGIKGMKWGVRNGPPYPIDKDKNVAKVRKCDNIIEEAIKNGEISTTINENKQKRHTRTDHTPGRSYLNGDIEYAQELVDKLSGTGEAKLDSNGKWTNKEMVTADVNIGIHVNPVSGKETKTKKATIIYSKTGTHIYPRLED